MASKFGGAPVCPVCQKRAYPAEAAQYNGVTYHKACLRCTECKKTLSPSQCQLHDGKIYCMQHYRAVSGAASASTTAAAAKPQTLAQQPKPVQVPQAPSQQPVTQRAAPRGVVVSQKMAAQMLAPATGSLAQRVFAKYDHDGDGSIGVGELKKLCMEMGALLSDDELAMAIKVLDIDGNGTLEFNEFEAWWRREQRFDRLRRSEQEMAFLQGAFASFVSFDADGNGTLDPEEFARLHAVLETSGYHTHDVATDMADMDRDGSGTISFNEYVEWLLQKAAEQADPRVKLAQEQQQQQQH